MTLWDNNLRHSPTNIVIDSVIVLVMAHAYSLQISHISSVGSTHGISAYFLLFNALFWNHQWIKTRQIVARTSSTDKSPLSKLKFRDELRGLQALGTGLAMLQVKLHWLWSGMFLIVSMSYPLNGSGVSGIFANPIAIVGIYMTDVILLMAFDLIPRRINRSHPNMMGIDMLNGISGFFNTWMSLIFVILQFYWQFLEFHLVSGSPGSLSLPSLALRAVVLLAVAVRWFQRLGPPNSGEGDGSVSLRLWYQWSWLPINCMIEGIGFALLVGMYLRAGWMGATLNLAGEGTPVAK